MLTKAKLASIEMDTSIQCRAAIDTAVVTDYAERMAAGDEFPDVILFGEVDGKLHIGDGWHRIMAARQNGSDVIGADIRKGGRSDALKHALGANALHGHRRTNADKRRCVEIALAEFGGLSSRAIAQMCGVGQELVLRNRPQVNESFTSPTPTPPATVKGSDGKSYPAKRTATEIKHTVEPVEPEEPAPATVNDVRKVKRGIGVQLSNDAINILMRIPRGDPLRELGLNSVIGWIKANR
jgi:hypothetical protein